MKNWIRIAIITLAITLLGVAAIDLFLHSEFPVSLAVNDAGV